ncbi:hypothetical protein KM043_016395 [Ampulex compressa]|nr:hypothetical protein KM043_016395 [Ampulex compressa]
MGPGKEGATGEDLRSHAGGSRPWNSFRMVENEGGPVVPQNLTLNISQLITTSGAGNRRLRFRAPRGSLTQTPRTDPLWIYWNQSVVKPPKCPCSIRFQSAPSSLD